MKVRIGFAPGPDPPADASSFAELIRALEVNGLDSIWFPEVLTTPALEPLTGLAVAAGLTERLKLGTHLIIPGRNPVRLARELATLDQLSDGRVLLNLVLGLATPAELQAQRVTKADRGEELEETLPLLRRLLSGEAVSHEGRFHTLHDVTCWPVPAQHTIDLWLGGTAPSALRRAGQLADGWMPGLISPEQAAADRRTIDEHAATAGRTIDPEHFGINVTYAEGELPTALRERLARNSAESEPEKLVPRSMAELVDRLEEYIAVDFTKIIVRPAEPPASWSAEIERLCAAVCHLQT